MKDTQTRDDTLEPEEEVSLCEFCSFALTRTVVLSEEDAHWRHGRVYRQLICTNQYVPSYCAEGAVTDCEGFLLYVANHAADPIKTSPETEEAPFKERLLMLRNKQLTKELKKLRKKMKKGKKGKKK